MKYYLIFLIALSFSGFANECLSNNEQKELGKILVKEDEAIQETKGECIQYWGARACLSPIDTTVKNYLEAMLKECSKETNEN